MRTAVIGLGIGLAHVAGYLKNPRAQLVAVADAWEPRRAKVGGTFAQGSMRVLEPLFEPPNMSAGTTEKNWEALGVRAYADARDIAADPEIELVSLCTPDDTHEELGIMLLEAGKHLLLEKPLALTIEGSRRLIDAAKANNRRVSVGYEFRVNPAVRRLRELLDSGSLGEVRAFSLYHYRTPFRRDKWQSWIQLKERSGGLIIEETCHWFDLARYLTGKEVASLNCVGASDIHPDFDYEDIAYVQGSYTDGAVFQISHALTGYDFSLVMQLHGTAGTAWCGLKEERYSSLDAGASDYLGVVSHGPLNGSPAGATVETFGEEATEPSNIRECTAATVDAMIDGAPFPAELEDGLESLRIALAARRSLREGNIVKL
jgi:myo-inositol 2-dehydrogenase/D-chiro-inositol 1-dehydrogenase